MTKMSLGKWLEVSIADQNCQLWQDGISIFSASVSTALNGAGELSGSECTPRGWHKIRARIGEGQPDNAVFVGRRATGEIYNAELDAAYPNRDWILTRILWLSGLDVGKNRLGNVDTMRRYIYIHGCPEHLPLGKPLSHGCIRMHNQALRALFEQVEVGLKVFIHE